MTPYENLANAIVMSAVVDYRMSNKRRELRDIERFFLSDWFATLTDADGRVILEKLKEEKRYDRKRISFPG